MLAEPESEALRTYLVGAERVISSELAEVEISRIARREEGELGATRSTALLADIDLVELDRESRLRAGSVPPMSLRSLDAVHLATALGLNLSDLVFVGYDRRLQEAASVAGLTVASPGA